MPLNNRARPTKRGDPELVVMGAPDTALSAVSSSA